MKNRILAWIDARFPLTAIVKHEATEYMVPNNLNGWWGFGILAMLVLVIQLATGIFLAMHFKDDALMAFDSVQHIMRDVNYGWLIRYLHSTGASAFFAVLFLHIMRSLYYGSYRAPREFLWWTGIGLLLAVMGAAFMGYLLPWGQMSFWGAQVITNLFGTIPLIGPDIVVLLRGDYSVGDPTLSRFFALHYLIPFIIIGIVVVHVVALHTVGANNPTGIPRKAKDKIPFYPYYTTKDALIVGIFLFVYLAFVFYAPNTFIENDNNIPANPMKTPEHIVPEWYFLPFYAILRSVPDLFGGVVAMGLSIVILAALPYLDRSSIPAGGRYRPIYRAMVFVFIIDAVFLGYIGSQPPEGVMVLLGRIASVIYFSFFVLLPFVSKAEEKWLRENDKLPHEVLNYIDHGHKAEHGKQGGHA